MQIHPYLTFNGTCRKAFTFYQQALGGTMEAMQTHGESPMAAEAPPEWRDRILHARLVLGEAVLMGSDGLDDNAPPPQGFSVSVQVETTAEAERVFGALAEGGAVQMPLGETFWAARFGMLVDRFGVPWMVNCDQPA